MRGKKINRVKVAVVFIILTGLIHLIEAPEAFEEVAYKGWLFALNGIGALGAAFLLFRGAKSSGWYLGLFIAAGSILGYVLSRTVGLPLIPPEPQNWFEPLGVASLAVESAFVFLFLKNRPS